MKAPSPFESVEPATATCTFAAAMRVTPPAWSKRKSPPTLLPARFSAPPSTWTLNVPAALSTLIEIEPPGSSVSEMPLPRLKVNREMTTFATTPVLVSEKSPSACWTCRTEPSESVPLRSVTFTPAALCSKVTSPPICWPAIVIETPVPVIFTCCVAARVSMSPLNVPVTWTAGTLTETVPPNVP